MAPDPKPRALELVESGSYGSTPDAPATPHAMNTSPCATLAVRATLAVIVLANVVLVASLLAIGGRYPALVSPGLLALGFGLRHGVDCDHIAAIDNVARKLAYSGKPAALVGLWFVRPQHDGRTAVRHRRDGVLAHPVARRRRRDHGRRRAAPCFRP